MQCKIVRISIVLRLSVKVGTHDGTSPCDKLVPATSRRDLLHRVNWPFLPQNLVARTNFSPCDYSHEFKPV